MVILPTHPSGTFFTKLRRFWRLIFLLIIAIGIAALYYFLVIYVQLSPKLLEKAEAALRSGIQINDEQHDFVPMGNGEKSGKPNNPNPYDLPFLDIKSLAVGIDQEYLYYKVQFWGAIPKKSLEMNGDKVLGTGVKLNIVDKEGEDLSILMTSFGYVLGVFPTKGSYYFYEPTGIEEPESARFAHQGRDSKVGGGVGTDYLIGAFPLRNLNLSPDQEIYLTLAAEAESKEYDHAAVDALLGSGKMGAIIKWKSGTNTYEIEAERQNSSDTPSIITPYFNEGDISSVNEAFGLAETNPYWGFRHPGIDFMTKTDLVPVRASASGTVSNITIAKESGPMGWHAGFCIQYDQTYSVCYNLETFSQSDSVGQKVRDNVFIQEGQKVEQGELIAKLVYGGGGTHIDFGVTVPGDRICPEPFFTAEAKESVLRLIHKDHPTWPMCTD